MMAVSLDSLSPEIIDLIVSHLIPSTPFPRDPEEPPASPQLSCYATVSKKWQHVIERYTFAALKTFSGDLPRVEAVVGASPRRRSLVKELWYNIDLPLYSDNRRWCLERPREHEANLLAFQKGIHDLWSELSTWASNTEDGLFPQPGLPPSVGQGGVGMRLVLYADAPIARNRDWDDIPRDGIGADRWSYKEHRLTLNANDNIDTPLLPQLPSVTAIDLSPHGRDFHPSAIEEILLSLPKVRSLRLGVTPPRLKSRVLRAEHRAALAKALEAPTLHQLELLSIQMSDYPPNNHSYQIASEHDPAYPDGDVLNRAVCKLAQRSLRELYLTESYLISPALWGNYNGKSVSFPYLERVKIDFPPCTYDGRWYYTGNPASVEVEDFREPSPEPAMEGGDSEYDSDESFNSEYADNIPFEREEFLNGQAPSHLWRTKPDPQLFDPLIRGLADAVLRMPKVESLVCRVKLFSGADYEIGLECLQSGGRSKILPPFEYTETEEQRQKRRWVVLLEPEATWDIPTDIRRSMEEFVGSAGEVITFQIKV